RRVVIGVRYGALLCDEQFSAAAGSQDQEALGFTVCRGVLHGLGGDVTIVSGTESSCVMEIQAPAAFASPRPAGPEKEPAAARRRLTAILLEPDVAAQRRLVSFWTSRGHRAVPVQNEAEALELLRRLKIDAVFCAVRFGPTSWVDFFDRVQELVPAFVLLTE